MFRSRRSNGKMRLNLIFSTVKVVFDLVLHRDNLGFSTASYILTYEVHFTFLTFFITKQKLYCIIHKSIIHVSVTATPEENLIYIVGITSLHRH